MTPHSFHDQYSQESKVFVLLPTALGRDTSHKSNKNDKCQSLNSEVFPLIKCGVPQGSIFVQFCSVFACSHLAISSYCNEGKMGQGWKNKGWGEGDVTTTIYNEGSVMIMLRKHKLWGEGRGKRYQQLKCVREMNNRCQFSTYRKFPAPLWNLECRLKRACDRKYQHAECTDRKHALWKNNTKQR